MRGRRVIAGAVDHIVSIASGGQAFPSMDGLRSLCTPCHSIKTNALDRAGGKGVAIKGCDENGLPLDPDHSFYGGGFPRQGDIPLKGREAVATGPAGESAKQLVSEKAGGGFPVAGGGAIPRDWGF